MSDLKKVREKVVFLDSLRSILVSSTYRSSLDVVELSGIAAPGKLTFEIVEDIKINRLRLRFALDEGAWSIVVNINDLGIVTIDESGPIDEVFESADMDLISQAVADKDMKTLLEVLRTSHLRVSMAVANNPERSGAHYLDRVDEFETRLQSQGWHTFISQIAEDGLNLVIGDLQGRIQCGGFCVCGPSDMGSQTATSDISEPPNLDARPPLPSPLYFVPLVGGVDGGEGMNRIMGWLNGVSRCLVWYWLATTARVEPDQVQLEFVSTRVVLVKPFKPLPASSSQTEIEIFQWSMTHGDPARIEAIRQAVTLAAQGDNADLAHIAVPALRTAKCSCSAGVV